MAHILDLIDKDFKAVILDVIRELKENTFKELKQIWSQWVNKEF